MARLAAKARCNYYPLPDSEAELIRTCLIFPDQQFSALDPCAGEGRAMAAIATSSKAVRFGIELDAYRAEVAAKELDRVIQGDALSTQARVESFSLIYAIDLSTTSSESQATKGSRYYSYPISHAGWRQPASSFTSCQRLSLLDVRRS